MSWPRLGLGTWKGSAWNAGEVGRAIKTAVRAGCRLLDCAAGYGNEHEIGVAVTELIDEGTVERKDLFISSKCFNTHHVYEGEDRPREALTQTLLDLQVDYLDLYLMHWPFAFKQKTLDFPLRLEDGTPNPQLVLHMEYLDTWRSLERLQQEGKTRAIGVSNFTEQQMDDILDNCTVPPAACQVELHPYLRQKALTQYCEAKGIVLMAYSPLGSKAAYSGKSFPADHQSTLLENPVVNTIANAHGRTAAQVLIRWSVQHGFVCIPKSASPKRIHENLDSQTFELTADDMRALDELDRGFRYHIGYETGHYDCENAPWGTAKL